MKSRLVLGSFTGMAAAIAFVGATMAVDVRAVSGTDTYITHSGALTMVATVPISAAASPRLVADDASATETSDSKALALIARYEPARRCTPGYKPCIPLKRSDVDCYGGGGNGPRYTRPGVVYSVRRGKDRYRLDSDHDGKGCERR